MRTLVFLLAAPFLLAVALPAADLNTRVPVLAELFTSEGCSSCPPADALLMKLDRLQPFAGAQIIVLSEHVDYWDNLGWKDRFSSEQFTQRQAIYDHALQGEPFTPQIVIDGRASVLGSDVKAIESAIAKARTHAKSGVRIVSAKRDDNQAIVSISIDALQSGKKDVWIALADDHEQSIVRKGENSGKTLDHVAVVRVLNKAGTVTKSAGLEKTIKIPLPSPAAPMRVVVFVAEFGGPVLGLSAQPLAE